MNSVNWPNFLTISRIVLIPIFILIFYSPIDSSHFWAGVLFCLAGITDWLDGYLARRLGQVTRLGAFLDPVADKMMVVVALVVLVEEYASLVISFPAMVIICREIAISALREWMAEIGKRAHVAVSSIGKVKTTIQIIAIAGLGTLPLGYYFWNIFFMFLLYMSVFLTIWSMVIYLRAAWDDLIKA